MDYNQDSDSASIIIMYYYLYAMDTLTKSIYCRMCISIVARIGNRINVLLRSAVETTSVKDVYLQTKRYEDVMKRYILYIIYK